MKLCHPYLSVVKVEEPGDRDQFYWPSFVELHRCAGGCFVSPGKSPEIIRPTVYSGADHMQAYLFVC